MAGRRPNEEGHPMSNESFFDKVKDFVKGHPEQADQGLDKAGAMLDEHTGGRYSEQIAKGDDMVRQQLGIPEGQATVPVPDTTPEPSPTPGTAPEPPTVPAPTVPTPTEPGTAPPVPGPDPVPTAPPETVPEAAPDTSQTRSDPSA
jgi:hypothetical protein